MIHPANVDEGGGNKAFGLFLKWEGCVSVSDNTLIAGVCKWLVVAMTLARMGT